MPSAWPTRDIERSYTGHKIGRVAENVIFDVVFGQKNVFFLILFRSKNVII